MKQRNYRLQRSIIVLMISLVLALTASCSPIDPVVSVGTPMPSATGSSAPSDTAAPPTPSAQPTHTPDSSAAVSPSTSPGETNGAGAYTVAADVSESQKTYYSEQQDENALRVENGAIAGIDGASIEKRSGDATSLENVITYGLNAAALVRANAQLLLINSEITAVPLGAGGAFACNGRLQLENSIVRATGDSAYAVSVSQEGSVTARESNLSTQGAGSPAIIAGPNSEVLLEGGIAATAGVDSPVINVLGNATVTSATLRANNAEAITVNGGSVMLTDCAVSGRMSDAASANAGTLPYCVSLYQNGASSGEMSAFSMTRGALTAVRGDLFYVTNTKASIYLEGVALSLSEGGSLLRVVGNDGSRGMGDSGRNGADCAVIAKNQTLRGDILVDALSSISLTLRGESDYTGTINTANTARAAKVTLEGDAVWTLTGNAYLTAFTGRVSSIVTNGFTVYVNGVPLTE
ncbi:MAG: hypothetical protein VB061_06580 [Christensenella sp.]|nr:hypothetical protein [Christensenella sp.]